MSNLAPQRTKRGRMLTREPTARYRDGKLDGLFQRWHSNGEKWEEYHYRSGKKEGLYQSWRENGEKWEEC